MEYQTLGIPQYISVFGQSSVRQESIRPKKKKKNRRKKKYRKYVSPPFMDRTFYPGVNVMQPMTPFPIYPATQHYFPQIGYNQVNPPYQTNQNAEMVSSASTVSSWQPQVTLPDIVGSDTELSLPPQKKQRKGKRKCSSASSIFKGVSWHKRDKCYMARVWINGASKHVGSYQEEMQAAIAVDEKLMEMGRDLSFMNFTSSLERDIARSILLNTKKVKVNQDVALEELKAKGIDRNGYVNTIVSPLEKILKQQRQREQDMLKRTKGSTTNDTLPMLDTLVDVASHGKKELSNDN